jgi:hypothetical protein
MLNVTDEQKKALRKIRTINSQTVEAVRNSLSNGCIEKGAYMQFATDVTVYGLWSALLSAHNYEDRYKAYAPGTVEKALQIALRRIK